MGFSSPNSEVGMNPKTKKIIAREGLIILSLFLVGLACAQLLSFGFENNNRVLITLLSYLGFYAWFRLYAIY